MAISSKRVKEFLMGYLLLKRNVLAHENNKAFMENQNNINQNENSLSHKPSNNKSQTHWIKESIVFKGAVIILIILLLLIPTNSIKRLIDERAGRQYEATNEVVSKWASSQQITGPILSIPTQRIVLDNNGNKSVTIRHIHILPEELKVDNKVKVNKLQRGLFSISVYENESIMQGYFELPNIEQMLLPNEEIHLQSAAISFGLNDLRGIKNEMLLTFGDSIYRFKPGPYSNDVVQTGLHTPVKLGNKRKFEFKMPVTIKGSSSLSYVPIGRSTEISMRSEWQDPSFYGSFLPDQREVTEKGFTANWKVIDLNRNFGQYWVGPKNLDYSKFGVEFIQPIDHYSKSLRSIKYSVLIICITFIVFFFIELLQKVKIHPVQYALVGFALIIFFLLLISISEHIAFNTAYLISSISVIGLITAYLKPVLKSWKSLLTSSGLVAAVYGFIFITLQDQDNALLIGSIGLFITLAAIMLLSRKINWYQN